MRRNFKHVRTSIIMLFGTSCCIALYSEFVVDSIEDVSEWYGLPYCFTGLIRLRIVGIAAGRHGGDSSLRGHDGPFLVVAVGASTQLALFSNLQGLDASSWEVLQAAELGPAAEETVVVYWLSCQGLECLPGWSCRDAAGLGEPWHFDLHGPGVPECFLQRPGVPAAFWQGAELQGPGVPCDFLYDAAGWLRVHCTWGFVHVDWHGCRNPQGRGFYPMPESSEWQ